MSHEILVLYIIYRTWNIYNVMYGGAPLTIRETETFMSQEMYIQVE